MGFSWAMLVSGRVVFGGFLGFKDFRFHGHEICIDWPRNSQNLDRKSMEMKWFFFAGTTTHRHPHTPAFVCSRIRCCSRDVKDITSILEFLVKW